METAVSEFQRTAKALKTLYRRRADTVGLLETKPAWKEYNLINADLVEAKAAAKRAKVALEQRAIEMFEATFNVNPAPCVSVVQTPVIEYDSEEGVIAWLCKNDMQDLLIPDWDAIKRRALATRDIHCVSVVMAPKVIVDRARAAADGQRRSPTEIGADRVATTVLPARPESRDAFALAMTKGLSPDRKSAIVGVDVAVPGPDKTVMAFRESGEYIGSGVPCGHPSCLSHLTHPCEMCGRTAGQVFERREQS